MSIVDIERDERSVDAAIYAYREFKRSERIARRRAQDHVDALNNLSPEALPAYWERSLAVDAEYEAIAAEELDGVDDPSRED